MSDYSRPTNIELIATYLHEESTDDELTPEQFEMLRLYHDLTRNAKRQATLKDPFIFELGSSAAIKFPAGTRVCCLKFQHGPKGRLNLTYLGLVNVTVLNPDYPFFEFNVPIRGLIPQIDIAIAH